MNDRPFLAEPMERNFGDFGSVIAEHEREANALAPYQGQMVMMATGREITAKKVPLPRNPAQILAKLKTYCGAFGDTYVYSWEVNDRANGRKQIIEGGTIKLANDLVQLYGNCSVDCDVHETPTHIIFKAWFLDYESGTSVSRLFQQRKDQNTGMNRKDSGRAADLIFQIGQSKAIRNVVLNALSSFANYAIEESKRGLVQKFNDAGAREKAWAFIQRVMDEHGIGMKQVEAVVGRREKEWSIRDLARVYQEMRGIHDGFLVAEEVYPSTEDAEEIASGKQSASEEGRKHDGRHQRKAEEEKAARESANDEQKPEDDKPVEQPKGGGKKGAAKADQQPAGESNPPEGSSNTSANLFEGS